jgi:hypothetical protein
MLVLAGDGISQPKKQTPAGDDTIALGKQIAGLEEDVGILF